MKTIPRSAALTALLALFLAVPGKASVLFFECRDGKDFTVELVNETEAVVHVAGIKIAVERKKAGKVLLFKGEKTRLRLRGDKADLRARDLRRKDCRANHVLAPWEEARINGVNFRAVGAGWVVDVDSPFKVVFRNERDEEVLEFGPPDIRPMRGMAKEFIAAKGKDGEIEIMVLSTPCEVPLSGRSHNKVDIRVGGRIVHGCGRELN